MQTWALNLLSSSPFNSPAITLSRSCGAAGGGLRWKKTFKLFFLLIWNLLLGQLLLGGLPLLDAVGDVDGDRLGAEVPAADVARDRHLQPLHWQLGQLWLEVVSFLTSLWQAGECDLWSAVVVGILDQLARSVLYPGTIATTASTVQVSWKREGACRNQRKWWSNFCFRHKTLKHVRAKRGSVDEIMQVWHWLQLIESLRASLAGTGKHSRNFPPLGLFWSSKQQTTS